MTFQDALQLLRKNKLKNLSKVELEKILNIPKPKKEETQNIGTTKILHEAIRLNLLENIPASSLTKKRLLDPDESGKNCFHLGACYECLAQILELVPEKTNLQDCLATQTKRGGNTVIHWAAYGRSLEQIPKNFVKAPLLLLENNRGESGIEACENHRVLNQLTEKIPLEELREIEKTLEKKQKSRTLLLWVSREIQTAQLKKELKETLYPEI